jgi:hypothetical protein
VSHSDDQDRDPLVVDAPDHAVISDPPPPQSGMLSDSIDPNARGSPSGAIFCSNVLKTRGATSWPSFFNSFRAFGSNSMLQLIV